MLELMYITNKPEVAKIAEYSGVQDIFIDMEYIGKDERQGGLNTVQNHHCANDVEIIKKTVTQSKVLVRVNPIHNNSKNEIDEAINAGADIIMLPYFKTIREVETFIQLVNKKAKTLLLLETDKAAEIVENIVKIPNIDQIHIGLNDLSLCYKMKFMFELMENGVCEHLCKVIKNANIKFGIGGIAGIGGGILPTEYVIREHYRLGSQAAILSRSFCNTDKITNLSEIEKIFTTGIAEIRKLEKECKAENEQYFIDNKKQLDAKIRDIKVKLYK